MSQTETHVGKLEKINKDINRTVEEWCKDFFAERNINQLNSYSDSWEEMFRDECDGKYIICNDEVYKVVQNRELDGDDVYHASLNSDGTVSYVLSFYNGGCGFSEALEYALNKLSK